ncbi:MAG: universal stress protein [Anaerolineae bacterium]|nr:universal stress protein [Anaerolineae bacterium]
MAEAVPFEKIVVPLDGSRWAEKAIPHAEQIARGGGELILLHVFKPAGSQFIGDAALANQTTHLDEARHNAERYVKELRSKSSSRNVRVRAHVVESGDLATAVCEFVTAEGADVVVMPAASHNRLARILMGDITNRVSGCVRACMLLVRGNLEAEWHEESAKALAARDTEAVPDAIPQTTAPAPDVLIQQLLSLRDAGILSAEECDEKIAEVQKRF